MVLTEGKEWQELFVFSTTNNVQYESGKTEYLDILVIAESQHKAFELAKEFLLSKKAFNVVEVVGQRLKPSNSVLIAKEKREAL